METHGIVILDGLETNPGDLDWAPIYESGVLEVYPDLTYDEDEIVRRIGKNDIVITVDAPITESVLSRCPEVRYVGAMATGFNHIDLEGAKRRGIPVTNVPSYASRSVARRAISLLLAISEKVAEQNKFIKDGEWKGPFPHWEYPSLSLEGMTMGLLGYGGIGRETAKLASALGMKTIASTRTRTRGKDEYAEFVSMDTLLSSSDVISLHAPLTAETERIINSATIEKMKDGVIIINTSRGKLVDEEAMKNALISRKVGGFGGDVFSSEPIEDSNPLLSSPNTILTPHSAWTGKEARRLLIEETGANIKAFLDGKDRNRVN